MPRIDNSQFDKLTVMARLHSIRGEDGEDAMVEAALNGMPVDVDVWVCVDDNWRNE